MTYSERIHNRLDALRNDNSARADCTAIAAEADAEIDRLRAGHDRYEVARRMSPAQWRDAWVLNQRTGKPFDEIVADLAPFFGLRVVPNVQHQRETRDEY